MTYNDEGPINLKAEQQYDNVYTVNVLWEGTSAPWNLDGNWIIGGRSNQRCVQLKVTASPDGKVLSGEMTYDGEGPIGFKGDMTASYNIENQWGGSAAPWHPGGTWVLTGRSDQNVDAMDITSSDNGKTFEGSMTYVGEGSIGFQGQHLVDNNYEVSNQWGGSAAPWHRGGDMIIGGRQNQAVIKLKFSSNDKGKNLTGEMTYTGEGPIGFKAQLNPNTV